MRKFVNHKTKFFQGDKNMKILKRTAGLTLLLLTAASLPLQADIHPRAVFAAASEDAFPEKSRVESARYPNFIVYEISASNPYDFPGYEVESEQTGAILLQFPSDSDFASGFYPMEDGSLLCSRSSVNRNDATFWRLYPDGTKTMTERPYQIVSRDTRGRFLVEQYKNPAVTEKQFPVQAENQRYGIVDEDFETILLPIEYGGPDRSDTKSGVAAHFFNGYIILQKGGKYGLLDYDLQVKLPFVYDSLQEGLHQVYDYQKGAEQGVFFAETGITCKKVTSQYKSAALLIVETQDGKQEQLVDRTGKVLFTCEHGNSGLRMAFDENGRVTLDGKPLEIPALSDMSLWAEPAILAARSAGLVPDALNQRFQAPATRREFCILAVQLISALHPELVPETQDTSADQATFWDYEMTGSDALAKRADAAAGLGIIAGRSDGSFDPFAPVTRQDAAVILVNTAKLLGAESNTEAARFADLMAASEYAQSAIQTVSSLQTSSGERLMGGSGDKFLPTQPYTIEQAISTMYRLYSIAS
ncbi:S-layer homology domain-containing protein [Butyricicoccus sp. 1XD8-22]|nr:S-layer homology domain-containing protein [Butyricicoccus sp. 1XD8-22]